MIDEVAEKFAKLERANAGGSLSNVEAFRASIERFQAGIREQSPSVIEVSTSRERQFNADMINLVALAKETRDAELRRTLELVVRSLIYLEDRPSEEAYKKSRENRI